MHGDDGHERDVARMSPPLRLIHVQKYARVTAIRLVVIVRRLMIDREPRIWFRFSLSSPGSARTGRPRSGSVAASPLEIITGQ